MTGPGMAANSPRLDVDAPQIQAIFSAEIADLRVMVASLQERVACIEAVNVPANMSSSIKSSQPRLCCEEQAATLNNSPVFLAGCNQLETHDGVPVAPKTKDTHADAHEEHEPSEDSKGSVEKYGDHWEFEEDTFTVGLLALATGGLPAAIAPLALALLTPLLQLSCFFAVFSYMVEDQPEVKFDGVRLLASFACFFLMGLQLTNEMLEGYHKIVFSWRCFSGKYSGVHQTPCIMGVMLGFFQLSIPCFIVGLSMQLVLGAESLLDAFMNYVALIFITEIDNSLIASRVVRKLFDTSSDIHVQYSVDATAASKGKELWTVSMTAFATVWALLNQTLNVICLMIAGGDEAKDPQWWLGQLPVFAAVLVVLNLVMRYGSLRFGAERVAAVVFVLAFTFCIISYTLHLLDVVNMVQSLTNMTLFTFSILCVPLSGAAAANPFAVLHCPYRLPSLCWLLLIGCILWTWHFNIFKYS